MYTQCPECLTVFSLDAPTLAQAHGYVTCSSCGADFDSLATLTDALPPEPFDELALTEQALTPPRVEQVVYRPRRELVVVEPAAVVEPEPIISQPAAVDDFTQLVFAPRFARNTAPKPPRRSRRHLNRPGEHRRAWAMACAVLTLLLGAQVAWAKRAALIVEPTTGAWLRSSCAVLHCRLPLVAAPDRLRLLDNNVQTHPSVPHALMISARVRNDAAFAQPYPVLTVTLSNAQGKRVAMRRLRPSEYLDDTAVLQRGLAPGATTVLLLEVADPGDQAVAFEFAFE